MVGVGTEDRLLALYTKFSRWMVSNFLAQRGARLHVVEVVEEALDGSRDYGQAWHRRVLTMSIHGSMISTCKLSP